MKKLDDIGVAILSHGRLDKLEKSLHSYVDNGLIETVGDSFVFFNEVSNDDINLIEHDFSMFEWGGHPQNLGIGWGMTKAIEDINTEYVLFLENDFELEPLGEDVYLQLEMGYNNIESDNVDIVRLRTMKDYLETSNEAKQWAMKNEGKTGTGDWGLPGRDGCVERNWWMGFAAEDDFGYNNPDICEEIDQKNNIVLWRMSCNHANWSNNPFLCKKDWFLKLAKNIGFDIDVDLKPSNQRSPDFEEQMAIESWWQKQDYKVGILPGLFIHQYGG